MGVKNFKQAKGYKLAFEQAMDIFEITKNFPKEETYSLTGQIRHEAFVPIWLKHTGKKFIPPTLSRRYQIVIQKILKQVCGLIFLFPVNTFLMKCINNGSLEMK
jgi:hypothetical protein